MKLVPRPDRPNVRRLATLRARQLVDIGPPRLSLALVSVVEGRSGEPELGLLPALVRPGSLAVDAGANRGVYALQLSRLCPRVVACEPQPRLARRLAAATPDNVLVLPVALSSTPGEATLRVPVIGNVRAHTRGSLDEAVGGESHADVTVLRLRLDDLALTDVGFVKLDVEGHELPALDGAAETIRTSRPRLLIECDVEAGSHPATVAEHLAPLGYGGWFHFDGAIVPIGEFDAGTNQGVRKEVGGPRPVARATNFLFLPHDEADAVLEAVRAQL